MKRKKIIIIGDTGRNKCLLQQIVNSKLDNGFDVQIIDKNQTAEIERLGLSGCIDKNEIFTQLQIPEMKVGSYADALKSIPKKKKHKGYENPYKYHR